MADDWKSYIDLDGTHVHMAANSPTTVAELLEQRGLHRAQIVQTADATDHHLIAELLGEAWQLADFAARHELVPRLAELQARIDRIRAVMDSKWPDDEAWEDDAARRLEEIRAVLRGDQPEVPGG